MLAKPNLKVELIKETRANIILNSKIKNIEHAEELARRWSKL